jgi:crossover junction endodeoxyribonuclease RusA
MIKLTKIPTPPSTNTLFANVPGKGRVKSDRYRTWRNAAGWEVRAQKALRVKGPVHLTYTYEEGATRADLGNLEKAATDMLVDLGIIDGDGPAIVRSITLQWGKGPGMTVEVRQA